MCLLYEFWDIRVEANEAAIVKAKERYGYFALLSNEVSEPIKALDYTECAMSSRKLLRT